MNRAFSKSLVASLAAVVLASFALAPVAEAAREGRGGGGGGGGGGGAARAGGGGGGGGGGRQVDSSKADTRSNNVRSTSANSVNNSNTNVNRNTNVNASRNTNVNVNVDNNNNCCGGGWDNDYHPVGTAVAVGATIAVTSAIVGSMVRTVPPGCVPVNYSGMVYQQCGSTWYQPQGSQFVVVNPPY